MTLAVGSVGPRHRAHRVEVRHQQQIAVDVEAIVVDLAIVAGHALDEDRFRHAQVVLQEFAGRKELAARNAGNVGNDRLDFVDLVFNQPLFGITRHKSPAVLHGFAPVYSGTRIDPNVAHANTSRFAKSVANNRCIRTPTTPPPRKPAARTAAARRAVASAPMCASSAPDSPDFHGAASRASAARTSWCSRPNASAGVRPGRNGGQLYGGQRKDVDWLEARFGTIASATAVGSRRGRQASGQTADQPNSRSTAI